MAFDRPAGYKTWYKSRGHVNVGLACAVDVTYEAAVGQGV